MPHVQTRWQSLRIEPYISKKTLEHFRYSLCINSSIHVSCTRWHQPTNLEAFKATSRDTRLGSPASLDLFAGLNSPVQAINATRVSLDTALASFTRRTQTQTAKKQQLVKWHASVLAQPASTQPPRGQKGPILDLPLSPESLNRCKRNCTRLNSTYWEKAKARGLIEASFS